MWRCCCSESVATEIIGPPPGPNLVEEAIENFRRAIAIRQRERDLSEQCRREAGVPEIEKQIFVAIHAGRSIGLAFHQEAQRKDRQPGAGSPSWQPSQLGTSAGLEHGFQASTGSNMEAEDLHSV